MITAVIILSAVAIGFWLIRFKPEKEPKGLIPRSTFGKYGKELGEFEHPVGLAIKDSYLFVADTGNSRIQILKIKPDGSLAAQSTFGKEGTGLGEFKEAFTLAIKDSYLFVADTGNSRIQVIEMKN